MFECQWCITQGLEFQFRAETLDNLHPVLQSCNAYFLALTIENQVMAVRAGHTGSLNQWCRFATLERPIIR